MAKSTSADHSALLALANLRPGQPASGSPATPPKPKKGSASDPLRHALSHNQTQAPVVSRKPEENRTVGVFNDEQMELFAKARAFLRSNGRKANNALIMRAALWLMPLDARFEDAIRNDPFLKSAGKK